MTLLIALLLVLAAVGGTAVALTREPAAQAIVLGGYGLILSVLFLLLQAPDVALSQLTVGGIAFPVLILLTLGKLRRAARHRARVEDKGKDQDHAGDGRGAAAPDGAGEGRS